jgi:hypothetical protein
LLIVGDYPIRQLVLHPRILVGWFFWELNSEMLVSLWLKASATWGGGSLRPKASVMGRRAMTLFDYALAFALQLRKSTENLRQGSNRQSEQKKGPYKGP